MAAERPGATCIGDAIEASLAVGWYPLGIAGVLLGTFVSPLFFVVVVVGVSVDWILLRRRVARRLRSDPRIGRCCGSGLRSWPAHGHPLSRRSALTSRPGTARLRSSSRPE